METLKIPKGTNDKTVLDKATLGKPKNKKSSKYTVNKPTARKNKPFKDTRATDSDNCNLGSARGWMILTFSRLSHHHNHYKK